MNTNNGRRRFIQYALAGTVCGLAPGCAGIRNGNSSSTGGKGLHIVFYTDVHARREWDTPLALEQAAEAINAIQPDLVLGGGDLITDGFQNSAELADERWDVYMKLPGAIRAEHHSVIGNHDLVGAIPEDGSPPSTDPRAAFRQRLGVERTYYSFDALGYHFMLLDSIQVLDFDNKYRGYIGPEQLEWIREDLSAVSAATPIVVVLHIPLLTGFYQAAKGGTVAAPASRIVVNNTEVSKAFARHNLLLVLQGHLHVAEMLRWRATTLITGGAICGRWWRGAWHGTREGFCSVRLLDGRVDWEYLTYGWQARRP